jgi:single-stranded DNA-binding protein
MRSARHSTNWQREEIVIDGLIAGTVYGKPTERVGASGKAFVAAKVRAADSDGEGQFVNVVAFDGSVKTALLALSDGDSVSLAGAMKIGTFEARDGTIRVSISMVAHAVLTAYHVRRKRDAVAQASGPKPEPRARATATGKRVGLAEADALFGDPPSTMKDQF